MTAAAAHRDLPVVLSALLPTCGRQQQQAAGSSGCVAVGVDAWLPVVVAAAAAVQGEEEEEEEEGQESGQEDAQSEGGSVGPRAILWGDQRW